MNTRRKRKRKPYPSDVSDAEWGFVVPYLTLMRLDAPQREHDLRDVFDALRWIVRSGSEWRMLPHDLPPWEAVYQQSARWLRSDAFAAIVHDLRVILRLAAGRAPTPTATIFDSRTLQSSVESGERAGYDGAKRKRGSKIHLAVDTKLQEMAQAAIRGRDRRVYLALSATRVSFDELTQAILNSMATRVALFMNDKDQWRNVVGSRLPFVPDPIPGRGFIQTRGALDEVQIAAPVDGASDEERLAHLRAAILEMAAGWTPRPIANSTTITQQSPLVDPLAISQRYSLPNTSDETYHVK